MSGWRPRSNREVLVLCTVLILAVLSFFSDVDLLPGGVGSPTPEYPSSEISSPPPSQLINNQSEQEEQKQGNGGGKEDGVSQTKLRNPVGLNASTKNDSILTTKEKKEGFNKAKKEKEVESGGVIANHERNEIKSDKEVESGGATTDGEGKDKRSDKEMTSIATDREGKESTSSSPPTSHESGLDQNKNKTPVEMALKITEASRNGSILTYGDRPRVICTMVQNEQRYLREWIEFHILAGFNKFMIFDHESTDNTSAIIKSYPSDVVEYHPVDWRYRYDPKHKQGPVQQDAYIRCFEKYWKTAEAIAIFDVDEFIYPGEEHWNAGDVFKASFDNIRPLDAPKNIAMVVKNECFKYGFDRFVDNSPEQNVVKEYKWRAVYSVEEWKVAEPLLQAAIQVAKNYSIRTNPRGEFKLIYFPNGSKDPVLPEGHRFHGNGTMFWGTDNRTHGFNCNHIYMRSFADLAAKSARNRYSFYANIAKLGPANPYHKLWAIVEDRSAWDFFQVARKRRASEAPDDHLLQWNE